MADKSNGENDVSETEVRKIVREELKAALTDTTTRRNLLGALGIAGMAGFAGTQFSDASSLTDGSPSNLRITDGESKAKDNVGTLHFRENLSLDMSGNQVSVDAGVDVAGSGGESTQVSSIDIGPGLDATIENGTLIISQSTNQSGTGVYLARPGKLQSALDDAASDALGHVRLAGGETYEIGDSIEVPPGVTLDCSGAQIKPQSDVNVFELHTQSQIYNPYVKTTQVNGYSSSIFHVSPKQFDESFGTNRSVPLWTVFGGWSEMTPGQGTCIELHGARESRSKQYDATKHNRNVYFCFIAHNCTGGRRFAYLHREGGSTTKGGHVNSNIIKGYAVNATRFVETNDSTGAGKNMVNGNKFYLVTQPGPESEWLWYANKGARNELYEWGTNWDYAKYSDSDGDGYAESWYIGPNAGMNFLWRKQSDASGGLGSTVVDESNGSSGSKYLVLEELGTSVDELEVWNK